MRSDRARVTLVFANGQSRTWDIEGDWNIEEFGDGINLEGTTVHGKAIDLYVPSGVTMLVETQ